MFERCNATKGRRKSGSAESPSPRKEKKSLDEKSSEETSWDHNPLSLQITVGTIPRTYSLRGKTLPV